MQDLINLTNSFNFATSPSSIAVAAGTYTIAIGIVAILLAIRQADTATKRYSLRVAAAGLALVPLGITVAILHGSCQKRDTLKALTAIWQEQCAVIQTQRVPCHPDEIEIICALNERSMDKITKTTIQTVKIPEELFFAANALFVKSKGHGIIESQKKNS